MKCLYYVLLSISALCYSLPMKDYTLSIKQDTHDIFNTTSETKTFSDSDVFLSSLLPPSSISNCLTSGYCNQGNCVQGTYLLRIVKQLNFLSTVQLIILSTQMAPLVQSSASASNPLSTRSKVCALWWGSRRSLPPGSGRRTLPVLIEQSPHSSLVLGLFGADWFYLSCGDAIFISIGLNKLLASSIAILLMCHMSGWCVVYLSYQTYKKLCLLFMSCHVMSCLAGVLFMSSIQKNCACYSQDPDQLWKSESQFCLFPLRSLWENSSILSFWRFDHTLWHRLLLRGHLLVVVRLHQALHWTLGEVSMNSRIVPSSSHISHICSSGTVAATSCILTAGTCRWTTVAHKPTRQCPVIVFVIIFSMYQTKLVSCSSKALLDMW